MKNMTDKQINRAIARRLGLLVPEKQSPESLWPDVMIARAANKALTPNFCNDLNMISWAVRSCLGFNIHAYACILAGMVWLPEDSRGWQDWRDTLAVSEATAKQRSVAF